jgi:hypothetical protein
MFKIDRYITMWHYSASGNLMRDNERGFFWTYKFAQWPWENTEDFYRMYKLTNC